MRSPRFLFLLCSTSLLPFLLCGCGSTASTGNPQNPSGGSGGSGDPGTAGTSTTAAYIYVANQTGTGTSPSQIVAYSADANGQLTPVPGSPFNQDVGFVEVNSSLLVASANTQPDIDTYKIGSDGAITLATQFDYSKQTGYKAGECGGVSDLYFDRSGQSVYATVNNYQCADNNAIASFAVDPSAASLNYLGIENIGYDSSPQIAFLGNNAFAYSALNDTCMYGGIDSFARGSNGLLTSFATNATPQQGPPAPPGAASAGVKLASYAAGLTATDNANHIAMEEDPCFQQNGTVATQVQLAVWTADATGAVTTTDTSATMPGTKVSTPMDMKISPSGTLLAVGGIGGLQVFHFNGASSITADTDVLTTDSVARVAWDSHNHLYAITSSGVGIEPRASFTCLLCSDTGSPQPAPGSPYTLANPWDLAVQSK